MRSASVLRLALDHERPVQPDLAPQRPDQHGRRALHSGHGVDPLEQRAVELRAAASGFGVLVRAARRHLEREDVARVEAEVDAPQVLERARQQPRAGEQDRARPRPRWRRARRAPGPGWRPGTRAARAFGEDVGQRRPRGEQGGHEAGGERGRPPSAPARRRARAGRWRRRRGAGPRRGRAAGARRGPTPPAAIPARPPATAISAALGQELARPAARARRPGPGAPRSRAAARAARARSRAATFAQARSRTSRTAPRSDEQRRTRGAEQLVGSGVSTVFAAGAEGAVGGGAARR